MQSAELIADDAWDAPASPDRMLGPLAGLLITRWASHDESEREAIAAFDEEVFSPELPEALRRSAWDDPTRNHASQVAAALGAMATRNDAGSAAVRHVGRVAPLVTHAVEGSPSTYERLYARVRQIDFTRPGGRTLAARLFDDVLRTVMARQGNRAGEFVTPNEVATLMLELADPQPGDRVYDPCFGFGELLVGAARRLREAARTAPPPRVGRNSPDRNLRYRDRPALPCGRSVQNPSGRHRSPRSGSERCARTAAAPQPFRRRLRLHHGRSTVGHARFTHVRGSVSVPEPTLGDPVPATRDGEPASRGARRRRAAGRTAPPPWSRSADEEGAAFGLQRGCGGVAAGRRVRALDRHCREPLGVSACRAAVRRPFRKYLGQCMGVGAGGRWRWNS